MKILIVIPTFKYATEYPAWLSFSDFPVGMAYLASALKAAGHEVQGCSPNNTPGYVSAKAMLEAVLTKRIKESQPELIGLGGLCTDYAFLRDAIEIIRKVTPDTPVVLGGQIVTNDAEDVFKLLQPDWAVVGEGEAALASIASEPTQARGIWHGEPEGNLDNLPYPDYEPFGIQDMIDNFSMATRLLYRYSRPEPRPYGIVTARGCPFSCTFCVDHHRSYRERSIPSIMDEIKVSYEKYHFNILLILDELFAVNKQRMRDFCVAVLKGKEKYGWDFDWMFQTHASAKLDYEHLCLAKEAGCFLFSYGLESASPKVLKSMNKKIEPLQVIEAIQLAEEAQVGFSANLIFGDPAETMATFAESISFWLEHCSSAFVFLGSLMPYPGSAVFEAMRERGMFQDKKEYYEKIDQVIPNMTAIADREYVGLVKLIQFMEQSWLFTAVAPITKMTKLQSEGRERLLSYQGGDYYLIEVKCPYCQQEIGYKERLLSNNEPFYLGTGCPKCGRKIKVVSPGG